MNITPPLRCSPETARVNSDATTARLPRRHNERQVAGNYTGGRGVSPAPPAVFACAGASGHELSPTASSPVGLQAHGSEIRAYDVQKRAHSFDCVRAPHRVVNQT